MIILAGKKNKINLQYEVNSKEQQNMMQ